jgi:murein DD-endopeptidase MepM/ murein hydrolase activator NlpD
MIAKTLKDKYIENYATTAVFALFLASNLSLLLRNKSTNHSEHNDDTYNSICHLRANYEPAKLTINDLLAERAKEYIEEQRLKKIKEIEEFSKLKKTHLTLSSLKMINTMSEKLKKDIEKGIKCLGCANSSRIRVYHREGKVEFIAWMNKNGRYRKKIIKYKDGFYNAEGTRLDVAQRMSKPIQLVTSKTKPPRISSGYGPRIHPILKVKKFHAGIDVAAPIDSKIHTALDGKVKRVGYNAFYGTYIIIQHDNNLETLYAHLNSIDRNIKIGKLVKQGECIGKLGKTGRATGAHLHFEVRENGKHIDPAKVKPIYSKASKSDLAKIKKIIDSYV